MADRTRPEHFEHGPACPLCGWPNVKPGHNRKERNLLRDNEFRARMAFALGVIRVDR